MKQFTFRMMAFCIGSAIMLSGCSKTNNNLTTPTRQNNMHVYGLNPMQPSDWANVPVFSKEVIAAYRQTQGIPGNTSLPDNYLLRSPNVRDQGQIGSCTGFCGTETNEMVEFQNSNTPSTSGVNYLTGISYDNASALNAATGFQIPNTSQTSYSSALSPLFLYYVERCVINNGSINSDPGAYMVNIGQALQGLSNNTGSGAKNLTTTQKIQGKPITITYTGQSPESDYTYPYSLNSSGYNIATSSYGNYKTAPGTKAITDAIAYKIAVNPANSSTSSGSLTTGGYYVINSTNPSDIVNDVRTAIAYNLPVMMGFNVYDDKNSSSPTFYHYFERLGSATNYTYNPVNSSNTTIISGLSLLGGHAVPIIGYIKDDVNLSSFGGGVFIVQNSWGTPWGYSGYFYLPFNVLTNTSVVPSGNLYVIVK
jgi:hypothetical protein